MVRDVPCEPSRGKGSESEFVYNAISLIIHIAKGERMISSRPLPVRGLGVFNVDKASSILAAFGRDIAYARALSVLIRHFDVLTKSLGAGLTSHLGLWG